MRIAFVLNSSGLYGANRSLLGLIEHLCEKGHKCFAILPMKGAVEEEFKKLGVEYKVEDYRSCVWYPGYIGAPFLVNLKNIPRISKLIKAWNVDLIHSNNSNYDIGIILAKLLKKKHVWHVREIMEKHYHTKNIFPRLYKWLRAESDAVICVSQYTYNYHMEHYPNDNMKMIYNPYDVEYYNIERTEFASKDKVTILMAGSMNSSKRQMDGVKAIDRLVKHGIQNIELILAGGGDAGYIEEISNYISDNHLEGWIRIVDFVQDLRALRNEADIALCCSVDEALPRVVVEGMLGEMLAIGANSGGVAELIEHKKRGLLYEVGDYKGLAEQIEYAINHKKECRQMIEKAKKYAIENFELKRSGERMMKVYNEILSDK